MNHSAALITKMSCAQLNYLYRHRNSKDPKKSQLIKEGFQVNPPFEYVPTQRQISGNRFAQEVAEQIGNCLTEMRAAEVVRLTDKEGHVENHCIYYTFDIIHFDSSSVYEIKQPYRQSDKLPEEKYVTDAVIQLAFYCSMHEKKLLQTESGVTYVSAKFKMSERFESCRLKKIYPILLVGDDVYTIKLLNPGEIYRFFATKLRASLDYETAIRFDNAWRGNEWYWFSHLIDVKEVT